jgi:pimeloyl-ACP methyl ester carboxylesterase
MTALFPLSNRCASAMNYPTLQLAVIPQCGHVPHEECPVEFMQAVEDFLK